MFPGRTRPVPPRDIRKRQEKAKRAVGAPGKKGQQAWTFVDPVKGESLPQNPAVSTSLRHRLLVPSPPRHEHGDPAPTGTIVTMRPDEMWGTDATRFYTERDRWCWFFGAVDHDTTGVMGWHIATIGDRWAALEPIRQGMTMAFAWVAPKVALGVALRHDWGSKYSANTFVNAIKC